jgi:adenosylhomocysteine nucleosidase
MTGEIKQAGDRRILYVMAAEAEYGQHLKARFVPLLTGVGPVESAVAVSTRLALCSPELPDCIVSLGSAGSNVLEQTGIYQVSSVSYRDMDASPLGFEKGRTPFLDLPAVLPLPVITGPHRRFRQPGDPADRPPHVREAGVYSEIVPFQSAD